MPSVFPFLLGGVESSVSPARVDFGGVNALHVGCDWIQVVHLTSGGVAWDLSAASATENWSVEVRESERSTSVAMSGSVLLSVSETDLSTGKVVLYLDGAALDASSARRQYWLTVTATAGGYDWPILQGTLEVRGHRST